LRAGLIVAVVIPLSLLFASNLMFVFGVAGSLMSLGALDFGLLVDSAVIQVENVVAKVDPNDRLASARAAILEVRKPTLFGELIIAVVFLPILLLEGIEGKMFSPMALTMLFALLGSLLLSLTLVPALSTFVRTAHRRGPSLLTRVYRRTVRAAVHRPLVVIALSTPLVVGGFVLATRLGTEFVPRLSEGSIVLNTIRLAGVSLEESVRHGTQIERFLLERYPEVIDRIWTRTGTAEVTTDPMGVELSDVFIMLKDRAHWRHRFENQDILLADMRELVSGLPGMRAVFTQPIEMRLAEMGAGIRSDLGVVLHGDDYEVLREQAARIQRVLETIPGASDVVTEPLTGQPLLEVRLDHEALGRLGLMPRSVLSVVEALAGARVGLLIEGERRLPIDVVLDPAYRHSPERFADLWVTAPGGVRVPLSRVAELVRVEVPSNIQRESSRRRVVVQANVRERDLGSFVAEARRVLHDQVPLPEGYYLSFGGRFEHLERAHERLLIVIPLAIVLVLVLLAFTYRRTLDVVRVFVGVPFAAVGGVLLLWLRDMPLSVSAAVGFVALIGVSVLGDMVLVSTIRRRSNQGEPLRQAVEDAATERLRPVVMTALVAGLGFLPMALSEGFGAEVQRPLATVVVGGLITSVLATLLILPVLYTVVARRSDSS
ncbi:MAG TPA: efflux RND transporter permease subunit, partial [Myxococcota bacterium]|nr:efflux RND transporter permease subunit [Myxococcota bacterium]